MDIEKQKRFNEMTKRLKLSKGGHIKRQNYDFGGAVSSAAAGAGAGSAILPGIGTVIGGIAGFISGLFGGGPKPPNIVDPVTGQQITDAQGRVVASQEQLQSFAGNLQGVNGVQNQQHVLQQLQNVASGQGPNPAKAMLSEATGKNVANQAALQAGQRGASGNVGLMARTIGQQGAATQQQAVGQGATLQANQSLNALNSMGTIAGQQVGETQAALNAQNQAANTNQGQVLGAQQAYNTTVAGGQANVNQVGAQNTATGLQGGQALAGAAGAGGIAKGLLGGEKEGSPTNASENPDEVVNYATLALGGEVHKEIPGPHSSHVANYLVMAEGGKVPAMVSPGEVYLSPEKVHRVLSGEDPLKIGERIGGKPKVKCDSRKNDIVPKTLDEGGVVIKRTHAKNSEKAELFVRRAVHMKKTGGSK